MTAKPKNLNRLQNETLGNTKDLNEKFALLEEWLKGGEISQELYNSMINKIINRTMKNVKPSVDIDDRNYHKTIIEGEMQSFLDKLRKRLNSYLSSRRNDIAKLSQQELCLFSRYLYDYPHLKSKINRLLVVGLRYPDERINEISEEYIKKHRLNETINHADYGFWLMLWEDGNLVPLNAVRLMLTKTDEGYTLNPCFDKQLMSEIKPLIEFQRDKEIIRLQWARSLNNPERQEKEVERKQRRLDMFNLLLKIS